MYITGGGFLPGEDVELQVLHVGYVDGDGVVQEQQDPNNDGVGHFKWTTRADAAGNLVDVQWVVCEDDCLGALLELTAVGQASGLRAQTRFTDDRTINSVTLNGATAVTVKPSTNITARIEVTTDGTGSATRWRSTSWRISTTAGAATCVDHPNHDVNGTFTETFNVTAPSSEGTYNAYFIADRDDGCSQDASSTFILTNGVIVDATAPTITCPAAITVSCQAAVPAVNTGLVTASDNCGGVTVTHVGTVSDGDSCPETLTRTYQAEDDCGNTATCTQTIVIDDTIAPSITCPAGVTVQCSVDLLVPVTFTVTATDNCDASPTITCDRPSGSSFPVGTTTLTCEAMDACGNTSSCSFNVTRAPLGFEGFLPPVGGADATGGSFAVPLRTFKLKSTIPVKFKASCNGSPVLTGIHTLKAYKYSSASDTHPYVVDATPTDAATTGNQFRLTDSQWHFNVDTKALGMGVGKWNLEATLSDGSKHSYWMSLK